MGSRRRSGPSTSSRLAAQKRLSGQQAEQVKSDFNQGLSFGKELSGDGSLGRLGTDSNIQGIIEERKKLAQGLTSQETAAQRGQAINQINQSSELARRRLASAQARNGVRGATAANQQGQVIGQAIDARQNFERNLLLGDRQAKIDGLNSLESTVTDVNKFDLSQRANERFGQQATALGFAQLGATERGSLAQASAARAASQGGGKKYHYR